MNRIQRIPAQIVGIILVVAGLMSCQRTGGDAPTTAEGEAPAETLPAIVEPVNLDVTTPLGELRVAWVDMDSLLNGYDMYFDMKREMETITKGAEQQVSGKGRALEQRMIEFQNNMQKGLLTRSEGQKIQEDLGKEQQLLMQLQEQKRMELMEEEQVRLRKVQLEIQEFIKRYNANKGYHYILSVGLLYGDPRLSITQEVLDGLNAEYAQKRAKKSQGK